MSPMKHLTASLVVVAGLAGSAAAAAPETIAPGYWETTSQVVSPFPTKKVERRCITAADVDKVIGGSPNHIYTCTYPNRHVADGKIKLAGSCRTKRGDPVPITTEGVYTRDSLRMDAYIRPKIGGLSVTVHARTTGARIGDVCPTPSSTQ